MEIEGISITLLYDRAELRFTVAMSTMLSALTPLFVSGELPKFRSNSKSPPPPHSHPKHKH